MGSRKDLWLSLAGLVVALVWPILVVGYPLLFWDSLDYLGTGIELGYGTLRPPVYAYLIRLLHWNLSLWPVILGQVALAVWLIWRAMDALQVPWRSRLAAPVLIALSSLPFFVIWVMADILTGLMVLAAFILVARPPVRGWEHALVAGFAFLAGMAHVTHLPLLLGIGLVLLAAALLWPGLGLSRGAALGLIGAPVLAACLLVAANLALYGVARVTYSSPALALTRQVEDGLTQRTLDAECPTRRWRLCDERAALEGATSLWFGFADDSPLQARLGGMVGYAAEAAEIVSATTRRYWRDSLTAGIERAGAILLSRDSASFGARRDQAAILDLLRSHRYGYLDGGLDRPLNTAELTAAARPGDLTALAWAPLLAVGGLIAWRRRAPLAAVFLGVTLAAIIGNALVIGVGGDVEGRYHGRLAWLAVFGCFLAATSRAVSRSDRSAAPAPPSFGKLEPGQTGYAT
ncbi:hypothetical protein QWZ14_22440 [Paeniroseomonas aquatica]|uniref:Glycosyltransferase RgtA/B/C/D-like domain-containing protein n=1 Tax=Paeniroseomonas aquatica TaxID=373043 RepID=A0ABT8AC99_9PROT|nr:hypothetical protein [Paeniroseomonas aquatica]MDN3567148.1 hypothetical protein [Paeniroseomonas aquatica]